MGLALFLIGFGGSCIVDSPAEKQEKLARKQERRARELERGNRLLAEAQSSWDQAEYRGAQSSALAAQEIFKEAGDDSAFAKASALWESSNAKVAVILEKEEAAARAERERKREATFTTRKGTLARTVEERVQHVMGVTQTWEGKEVKVVQTIKRQGEGFLIEYRTDSPIFGTFKGVVMGEGNRMMKRIFTDPACKAIKSVKITSIYYYHDTYGHPQETRVATMKLDRNAADRVNWGFMSTDNEAFEKLLRRTGDLTLYYDE